MLEIGAAIGLLALSACATTSGPEGAPRKELMYAVTASNKLISFNAGQPHKILSSKPLYGQQDRESVAGIAQQVGSAPFAVALAGTANGFDVNAGKTPALVAAGYSYNKQDEKITTNFALDAA